MHLATQTCEYCILETIFCRPASLSLLVRPPPSSDLPRSFFHPRPKTCVISFFVCPYSRWEDSQTCSIGYGHIPRISDSVVPQLEDEFCEPGQLQSIQVCNARTTSQVTKSTKLGPYFPSPNEPKLFLILLSLMQLKITPRKPERETTKDATSRTEHSANDRVEQLVGSIRERRPREGHATVRTGQRSH